MKSRAFYFAPVHHLILFFALGYAARGQPRPIEESALHCRCWKWQVEEDSATL